MIVKNEQLETLKKVRIWKEFWSQHGMFVVNVRGSSRIRKEIISLSLILDSISVVFFPYV